MGLTEIVKELVEALFKREKEKVLHFLDSGFVFELPARSEEKFESAAKLEELLDAFFKWVEDGKGEVIRTVKSENTVWIERKDIWKIEGKWIEIPIVGIFEFREDKVSRWVEYLDFGYLDQFNTRPTDDLFSK